MLLAKTHRSIETVDLYMDWGMLLFGLFFLLIPKIHLGKNLPEKERLKAIKKIKICGAILIPLAAIRFAIRLTS